MTTHENYQKAFRHIQPSHEITMEELEMKKGAYVKGKIVTTISAVTAFVMLSAGACYAANVGGIQDTIQLWIHGNAVEGTIMETEDDQFVVEYEDESGLHEIGGGGVAMDEDGTVRPVTMDEYMEYLNNEVLAERDDDGHIYLYAQDQVIDITDQFLICETVIERNGEPVWVHVLDNGDGTYQVQTSAEPFDTWYSDHPEEEFEEEIEYSSVLDDPADPAN